MEKPTKPGACPRIEAAARGNHLSPFIQSFEVNSDSYTHHVKVLGLIARSIRSLAALQPLAIVPLLRVIAPCHGTNRTHS